MQNDHKIDVALNLTIHREVEKLHVSTCAFADAVFFFIRVRK